MLAEVVLVYKTAGFPVHWSSGEVGSTIQVDFAAAAGRDPVV